MVATSLARSTGLRIGTSTTQLPMRMRSAASAIAVRVRKGSSAGWVLAGPSPIHAESKPVDWSIAANSPGPMPG